MSAGTKLAEARAQIVLLEARLLEAQQAGIGARSMSVPRALLRRIRPYAQHRVDCRRPCSCELGALLDAIDDLLEDA